MRFGIKAELRASRAFSLSRSDGRTDVYSRNRTWIGLLRGWSVKLFSGHFWLFQLGDLSDCVLFMEQKKRSAFGGL